MSVPYDMTIRGGTVVRPHVDPIVADVAVCDGKIVEVAQPGTIETAVNDVDASGLYVMPGAVDPHAHIGLGGGLDEYGPDTASASIGGTTTVCYILIDSGPYGPVIAEHDAVASASCHVDYAFHLTLMSDAHVDDLKRLAREWGVTSYKYYMSFRGDEGAYLGIEGTDDGAFHRILEGVASVGGVLMIHPENIEIVWRLRGAIQGEGRDGLKAWNESRPPFVEAESTWRASFLAAHAGCPIYFVHVSSQAALDALRGARVAFPEASLHSETCPHYLTHDQDWDRGIVGKVNPPLRTAGDSEALWSALADGTIETLGSDHVGRRIEKKQGTVWTASAGFPGLPTVLPILLSEGHHRRAVPLPRIAELTSHNPARIFGLGDRKGDIRVGMDADFALIDLDWVRVVDASWLGTWSDYSIYDGLPITGWPRYTFVRGALVQEEGAVVGTAGHGQLQRR